MESVYDEIFKLLRKHEDKIVFDLAELYRQAKIHLFGLELVEKHGLDINPKAITNLNWQTLKNNIFIGFFDGERRVISFSDDGRQPKQETLLAVNFPTGAYIFGDHYPVSIFQEFFEELKTYEPKYTDTTNKSLYFSLDKAGKIYNDYDSIFEKYQEKSQEFYKIERLKVLEEELTKLKTQI